MFRFSKLVYLTLSIAMIFGGAVLTFAQDDPEAQKTALYEKFLACRSDPDPVKKKACYEYAREYLKKYGADNDEYVAFLQKRVKAYDDEEAYNQLVQRYESSVKDAKNINADEAFSSGKEILAKQPDQLDVVITLACVGLEKFSIDPKVVKYNADTIKYAALAIEKINGGAKTKYFGNYSCAHTTTAFPDGKSNALGDLNYTIGYIMFYGMNQKKEALPYLYKATQFNSYTQKEPSIYNAIGAYYFAELVRLSQEASEKLKANNGVMNDEIKQLIALQRGYTDRALHAYSRAYSLESSAPENKTFKDSLRAKMQELYEFRFDGKKVGLDEYITSAATRPIADPTTVVAPIQETPEASPTGATSATTTTPTATPKTTTSTTTTTTTTKPASTTTSTTTATTATKVVKPAKKPVRKRRI